MNLQQDMRRGARGAARGLAVAFILMAGACAGAAERAGEKPGPLYYDVQMALEANGKHSAPRMIARAGESFFIEEKGLFKGEFVVTPFGDPDHPVKLAATITDPLGGYSQQITVGRLGEKHLGR